MTRHRIGRLPLVSDKYPRQLFCLVTRSDSIKPNTTHFEEKEVKENLIKLGFSKKAGVS